MSTEVKEFYSNDVIYRFTKRKRILFGIVLDTYESTDTDDNHALKKGEIRVYWLDSCGNRYEQICTQDKVKLVSRSVVPGDIVRRLVQGKETQRGYCRSVKLHAAVQIMGTNRVIDNIPQDRLGFVHAFEYDTPVAIGEQFGRIVSCDFRITLQARCGTKVQIMHELNKTLYSTIRLHDELSDHNDVYHVGQVVILMPSHLKQPTWLMKSKFMKRNMHLRQKFVVLQVEPMDVIMDVQPTEGAFSYMFEVPNDQVSKLKPLKVVEENVPQLCERRMLKIASSDVLMYKREWLIRQTFKHSTTNNVTCSVAKKCMRAYPQLRYPKCPRTFRRSWLTDVYLCHHLAETKRLAEQEEESEWITDEDDDEDEDEFDSDWECANHPFRPGQSVAVEALCTDSKATIIWQDGSEEADIPTTQLYYSISLDDHEFFPGEWVIRADQNLDWYGVVQSVEYLERTALINWFAYSTEEARPVLSDVGEMSVYDIKKHPVFVFRPGSIVHRVTVCENNLGMVIDSYPAGFVRVKWMDGIVDDCWPQHIGVVLELHNNFLHESSEEASGNGISWETESVESVPLGMASRLTWQAMAARIDFIRGRITWLQEMLDQREHWRVEHFGVLKSLISIYANSSYLDRLMGTSYFSVQSRHYQALLGRIKERARICGIDMSDEKPLTPDQVHASMKVAERETINNVKRVETLLQQPRDSAVDCAGEPSAQKSADFYNTTTQMCVEFLALLKCRMDLSHNDIMDHIQDNEDVDDADVEKVISTTSIHTDSSDDSLTSLTSTPPQYVVGDECALDADNGAGVDAENNKNTTLHDGNCKSVAIKRCESKPEVERKDTGVRPHREKNRKQVVELPKVVDALAPFCFEIVDEAIPSHRFYNQKCEPLDKKRFTRTVISENRLLKEALLEGVWVYTYGDRLDLMSVMIRGSDNTPYEDGLFVFDLQLSNDYPRSPPHCNYISYNSERLNPNLYVEGKVCVSLLGTWLGRGTEVWGNESTLLQLIVSIQGLILVTEPYYNEAGYEKQADSQQGYENSRTYNELVLLRLVQSMAEMLENPYEIFAKEIYKHFKLRHAKMVKRLRSFIADPIEATPDFPLLPVSRGLKLSLKSALDKFERTCELKLKVD